MQFDRMAAVEIHPPIVALPFRVEGLRIAFQVIKDLTKTCNTAKITIYNLSENSRNRIRELDDNVYLEAGYAESVGLEQLFFGNIMSVSPGERSGPDILTVIGANDGATAMREKVFVKSYAEGFSAKTIIDDIIDSMGLPKKFVAKFKDSKFLKGFAHAGPAKDALDKICKRLGLEYSVQGGQIQILEQGKTNDSDPTAILVTPTSGLIGSPERIRKIDDEPTTSVTLPGWRIRCLLQPKITPGGWLAVQSQEITRATAFRVQKVQHDGDTQGDYITTVEVADPGVRI